jgi:hypothetical protein
MPYYEPQHMIVLFDDLAINEIAKEKLRKELSDALLEEDLGTNMDMEHRGLGWCALFKLTAIENFKHAVVFAEKAHKLIAESFQNAPARPQLLKSFSWTDCRGATGELVLKFYT